MVNVKNRIKAQTNTNRRGVGNYKKSCTDLDNVNKKPNLTHLSTVVSPNNTVKGSQVSTIARSVRYRKKNKNNLEVMDNIMNSELLIVESRLKKNGKVKSITNNINNNCIDVSNHNEKPQSNTSTPTKRKANSKRDTKVKEKRTNNESPQPTEPLLRENVVNKMKRGLSCDKNKNCTKQTTLNQTPRSKPKLSKKIEKDKITQNKTCDLTKNTDKISTNKCDYCQKVLENKTLLCKHLLTHDEWRPYKCPLCPKRFQYDSTFKLHLQSTHPNSSTNEGSKFYMCTVCDKSFVTLQSFEEHFKCHVKKDTIFKCIFCNKPFTSRLRLIEHEKSHSSEKQFKCDYCVLNFPNEKSFWTHMVRHSSVKDLICQYCDKHFLRSDGLRKHVQSCHDIACQTKKCPICNKQLKGHMSEHMRVHEQKRPHVCDFCGQRFTQSTQLTVHKRSHTGARPYSCKICERAFGHSNALMLHIRIHTGERPFQCALCPLSFSQLPHMKTHMIKIHNQEHAYKCLKCNKYFKLKKQLDVHEASCKVERELMFEEKIQTLVPCAEGNKKNTAVSLSTLRYQVALLLSKVADHEQLKCLGFNKRLIDDLVEDSIEAIGLQSCKDTTISQVERLKTNIEILFGGIVSQEQMDHFRSGNKTIEEILMLLTGENCSN